MKRWLVQDSSGRRVTLLSRTTYFSPRKRGISIFIKLFSRYEFDDEEGAAEVGEQKTTTKVPTEYPHPENLKIKFWDLPGMGDIKNPDLRTYCKEVQLEKYDAFLIVTCTRFTSNDFQLAEEIKRSLNKNFFFIRTKIDESVRSGKLRKKSFDESVMLEETKNNCSKELGDLLSKKEDIFLISNHHPEKWDFPKLAEAILDAMPKYKQESLTLALESFSPEIIRRKVEILKQRTWKSAFKSALVGTIPLPGVSAVYDANLIIDEINMYRTTLGLPEKWSEEFTKLHSATKETAAKLTAVLASYVVSGVAEEYARFIPFIGTGIAGAISFATTLAFLRYYLKKGEDAALLALQEAVQKLPNN